MTTPTRPPVDRELTEEAREVIRALEDQLRAQSVVLAETEQRLRTLFERAPFSIQLIDAAGRTLQVNEAWKRLWGLDDAVIQSFILPQYNVLTDPQLEAHGLTPLFHRALAGESVLLPAIRYDPTNLSNEARPRWVEGHLSPVKDDTGRVVQLVLIHRDITSEREARDTILRKSAEFAALFEHLPEPVILAAPDRVIALTNPAADALLGYGAGELIGKPTAHIYASQREHAQLGQTRHRPDSTAAPGTYEVRYRHKNGEEILTETTSSVVRTGDGEVIGYVGILRDVRERRRDEEMLRFLSAAGDVLAASLDDAETLSTLTRLAVPTLGDWCLMDVLDEDGAVRRAQVVCADPDDAVLPQVYRFPPRRDRPEHPPAMALFEAKAVLIPSLDRARMRLFAQTDDHARVMLATGVHSMICVPLIARARTLGVLTLLLSKTQRSYTDKDLSYARQLASKAAQALENGRLYRRATEAINARDEFLSVCSHELKTPLTSMKLQMQLAARQLADEPTLKAVPLSFRKRIDVAGRQLSRLDRLIDDMLDVSRIATGKLTMNLERTPLAEVVTETLEQMRERFEALEVPLEVQLDPEVQVSGDRFRLAQIVVNLLSNALKYGEGRRVDVTVQRSGRWAEATVLDRGTGISPEDQKRLFTRFERAAATKAVGGLGLGLYISRQIAEAHSGTIEVESSLGNGARFTLRLPLADTDPPEQA